MPWRDAPGTGVTGDDIINESGHFGPEWISLPEKGVNGNRGQKCDQDARNSSGDDLSNEADITANPVIYRDAAQEQGNLRAKHNSCNCEEI